MIRLPLYAALYHAEADRAIGLPSSTVQRELAGVFRTSAEQIYRRYALAHLVKEQQRHYRAALQGIMDHGALSQETLKTAQTLLERAQLATAILEALNDQ